ncbi:MAG: hypothetical protein BWK79_03565 [Beggiatoa sp. IS2]|nr:MAG: hypothetical protein BWK79_03565 [Beggiatoa sp. IS2]
MPLGTRKIKRWLIISSTSALFIALLLLLWMTSDALQNSTRFEHLYTALLTANALALITLSLLIGLNLRHLRQQVRKERAGARLTVRLVSLLIILTIIPVTIVYYFSLQFLHQRLDGWFDVNVEQALANALELGRSTLDARLQDVLKKSQNIAMDLADTEKGIVAYQLNELRDSSGAFELTLLAANGQIIASNSAESVPLIPNRPDETLLMQLKHSSSYVKSEFIPKQGWYLHAAVKFSQEGRTLMLSALFQLDERLGELVNSVERAFIDYKERTYLHKWLKLSFTLVLSLVLLLNILSAIWAAFFAARRFIEPLNKLAEGTKAVASGDYDKQLPVTRFDELGFLVQSFNEMTRKIALASEEVKHSQRVADSQRTYLEAVLARLSSGVISLDGVQCLRTANPAAANILGLTVEELEGQNLTDLPIKFPALQTFCTAIHAHLRQDTHDWREELTLFGNNGRRVLMCRGTQLQNQPLGIYVGGQADFGVGQVIVFDDVTALIQAQRDGAWSEVARRLAHEIKNPLTPIQLSAERLRHKYLGTLPLKEADLLDRMTHTIIQQVETLKEMVNAFSAYAKTPTLHLQPSNLNDLIGEVLDLYQHAQLRFDLALAENLPKIEVDRGRIRQVLHNLIKNAIEATPAAALIKVSTHYLTEPTYQCIELRIQDRGPGVSEDLLNRIFEPYVTTKIKGTGLGLAIVKKIVEEHGGIVWIENHGGVCVIIRLPTTSVPPILLNEQGVAISKF